MSASGSFIVTGASGFIGCRVVRELGRATNSAVLTARMRDWSDGELPVFDENGDRTALSPGTKYTLVHLAWCGPVRDTFEPHLCQLHLLGRLLSSHGNQFDRVVATGSAEEYGSRGGQLQEDAPAITGLSAYGWGKRCAHLLLDSWATTSGAPLVWLRPFLVYGENQSGNMVIPYAIRQLRANLPAEFSAATQRRDFIHVDDVARGIAMAAHGTSDGIVVANLGTGLGTPVREVLTRLAEAAGKPDLFRFGVKPMRPGEPTEQIASTVRAKTTFDFEPAIALEEGVGRLVASLSS